MKKIVSAIIVTLCSVLLVGCGNSSKNLNCSMDYSKQTGMSNYGVKTIADVDVNFKGNKIQDMKMSFTFTLPDSLKDKTNELISSMETTYKTQYSGEHFTVTTDKISDNEFSVSVAMDFKNMTDAEKAKAGMSSGSESYSVNKADLEKQGFTCK